jgi:hypothetical protein
MALRSIQPLTEMSTRNFLGGKGRPGRKADNLTSICELIVYKMWEPRPLTPPMGLHGLLQRQPYLYLYYATSRKAAGSVPHKVIGFFNLPNPSSHTMVPGST